MQRINTQTRAFDLFGAGKHGFKNGNFATGIASTDLSAEWFNGVQEELANLVEGELGPLDPGDSTQLLQVFQKNKTFTQTGSLPRSMQEKLIESKSVTDYFVAAEIDATYMFRRAASANPNKSVRVPANEYTLSGQVNCGATVWVGDGAATRVVFTHGGSGFVFAPTTPTGGEAGCTDMAILTKGVNGASAVLTAQDSTLYFSKKTRYTWRNLFFGGYTNPASPVSFETVEAWAYSINQGDAWHVAIDGCDSIGNFRISDDPAPQFKSTFIRLNAVGGMLTGHVRNFTSHSNWRGFEIGERVFFHISHGDIAHAYDGIYQTAVDFPFGESKLDALNINVQHWGVYFTDIASRDIGSTIVRRHNAGWKLAAWDWVGIKINNSSKVWLHDCECQPDESNGVFLGTAYSYVLNNCGAVLASDNVIGAAMQRGFLLDNCSACIIDNTVSLQNSSTSVIFRAINNTRSSIIGKYVKVSTFVGTEYSADATIGAGAVSINQQYFTPESSLPTMKLKRPTSAVDEKISKVVQGSASWAVQFSSDDEVTNVNALILNRVGTVCSSFELRTQQLKMGNGATITWMAGSPEGVLTAIVSSIAYDTTNGVQYNKKTGSGNTGWKLVTQAA